MERGKQKFDSVILAGGFGKRLAPLTDSIPKPMLPVAGVSAFERGIGLLRKCGFVNTAVTTMYLPERIEGIKEKGIEYLREEKPLGSAGAVAKIKDRAEDILLVMSGDAICNFDLREAKREFIKSGSDAGMLLHRARDCGEYGSVCIKNGRVTMFCEKPSVRDTLSDLINTGIYFITKKALDSIPDDTKYDFARDLFPALLKSGATVAGIEPRGYWFDIGSFGDYHQCNMWISGGQNCFGKKVSVHPTARIEHSVIMDNCTVGNSVLRGCILGEGAVIGNDCIIPSGCVIGPGAELRNGTVLAPGSIVQTGDTRIGEAFIDMFPCKGHRLVLSDDSVIAVDGDEGYYVRLGKLLGGGKDVIAFAQGDGMTLPQACEIACGGAESGSNCTVISGGNAATAAFAAAEYRSNTAYIYKNGENTEIKLFSTGGMPFSREELRAISTSTPTEGTAPGSVFLLPHGALIKRYLEYVKQNCTLPQKIKISQNRASAFLREISEELNIDIHGENGEFVLTEDGERAKVIFPHGREISYWQLLAICCIEVGRKEIILPNDTPNTVESILRRKGIDVAFYGDNDSDVRRLAESDRLHRDGTLLALTAAGIAEKAGVTIAELADRLPPFAVLTRTVFTEQDKMSAVISRLREEYGGRCAGFDFGEGRVNVYASASGRFRLVAEAVDSETAEEITLRAIDKLSKK